MEQQRVWSELGYRFQDSGHTPPPKALGKKQRQAARTPSVVFVVASHYQSLQIVVLLLQACLLGSLTFSVARCNYLHLVPLRQCWDGGIVCLSHRTFLLQQLHRLQQDRRQRCFLNSVPVKKTCWRPFYILISAVWDRVCIAPIGPL